MSGLGLVFTVFIGVMFGVESIIGVVLPGKSAVLAVVAVLLSLESVIVVSRVAVLPDLFFPLPIPKIPPKMLFAAGLAVIIDGVGDASRDDVLRPGDVERRLDLSSVGFRWLGVCG